MEWRFDNFASTNQSQLCPAQTLPKYHRMRSSPDTIGIATN